MPHSFPSILNRAMIQSWFNVEIIILSIDSFKKSSNERVVSIEPAPLYIQ